jgi:hypothetical protein
MIEGTIRFACGAALTLVILVFPVAEQAHAGPFKRRPDVTRPQSELGMVQLQQSMSQRQQVLNLTGRLVQSTTCKQCVNNVR